MVSDSHYEVVKIGREWCMRIRETGKPVAWSKTDDAAWRSYVVEMTARAEENPT